MAKDEAYREAEKKIETARRSVTTELDLSPAWDAKDSEKLTELPESVSQLTELQKLNLSGNRLTAVPESLGQLTQLLSLNLRSNQLTALPESMGQRTHLQSLEISYNRLASLPVWLGQLTQLRVLVLSSNQVAALPETLCELTKLQTLELSRNYLSALPKWLGQLTQLQVLRLDGNRLTELPEWLGQLTQLQVLSLSDNRLTELPESVEVALPEIDYKGIEAQLALGKASAEALLKGGEKMGEWLAKDDDLEPGAGAAIRAEGGVLRQLHTWLKEKDPSFGGLVRVQNKRQEFLWVHPRFETEY